MADDPKPAAQGNDPADNDTSPKGVVPEADHLALKRLHETSQADLKRAQGDLESLRARLAGAEDGKKTADTALSTLQAQVRQLETQLQTFQTQQVTTLRASLKARGVAEDKVKDADLAQLQWLESVLPPAPDGKLPRKTGFDASGVGGADVAGLSARGKIAHALSSNSK